MSRRLTRTLAALSLVACLAAAASAQTYTDGALIEKKTFDAWDYDKLAPWQRQIYSRETFDSLRNSPDVELLKIRYASDGLSVAGFIAKPKKTAGRLPVIIFNRGGLEESVIGMPNFNYIHEMFRYASEGFVVLASQYRGYDGAGGRDEVGGADLHDVFNIIKLARSLDYVDADRLFMWGYSRGALMTLQALRDGAKPRAVVLVGPPTDYSQLLPGSERFFRNSFPDYDRRKDEHLRNRTPMNWVEKIDAPLLILHGGDDNLPPTHSLNLARRMQELGKLYELVVYAGDNHPIILNREDRLRRTVDWFKNPRKMSASAVVRRTAETQGMEAALKQYRELQRTQADRYQIGEADLNRYGYTLLAEGRVREAVEVFKLNVELFPQAFNTYDSLAEAYAAAGERDLAIMNYRKSLELNPQNANAAERLKGLEKK
ncbi:MAG TPA: prolyl oligopeptidase family serine peptidase [Pyrinomonadaceae bacterium]|nr:prolyl oligopeptidase family serine peptidase [Pyrinomonadaceae bacterium]